MYTVLYIVGLQRRQIVCAVCAAKYSSVYSRNEWWTGAKIREEGRGESIHNINPLFVARLAFWPYLNYFLSFYAYSEKSRGQGATQFRRAAAVRHGPEHHLHQGRGGPDREAERRRRRIWKRKEENTRLGEEIEQYVIVIFSQLFLLVFPFWNNNKNCGTTLHCL